MSSQPPKDFLALTHGHEWVNFYESFDKLVQDHLSRSSELLQRAMSLPEVADREVQQIKEDLEKKLQDQREEATNSLTALKTEIGTTQERALSVAQLSAALAGDLEKLAERVEIALASVHESHEISEAIESLDDDQAAGSEAETDSADVAAAALSEDQASWEDLSQELETESSTESDEAETESDEPVVMVTTADEVAWAEASVAPELDSIDSGEIDLTALAADELGVPVEEIERPGTGSLTSDAKPGTGELAAAGERARPHWLSMTRSTLNDPQN
ncbi:MAG TPA: hypothetical protein PK819_02885 [Thermomicrobiales bacterium]|nr:hypothetical protein [Thermomicrobiales bacterium]